MTFRAVCFVIALALTRVSAVSAAECDNGRDCHAGYYYPHPGQVEIYTARAPKLAQSTRTRRVGFVVGIVNQMGEKPYPPGLSIFAKGKQAEKLIMVANRDGQLDTVFRVRAMLAMLTSVARTTPMFQQLQVQEHFTFLDLLKMLGFERLTVTDGKNFSHQIYLRAPQRKATVTLTPEPTTPATEPQAEPTLGTPEQPPVAD